MWKKLYLACVKVYTYLYEENGENNKIFTTMVIAQLKMKAGNSEIWVGQDEINLQ